MNISEKFQFIPVIEPANYGSAGKDGDSVNMGKLHHIALAITFGALTGNSVLKFYKGATAGAKTTAVDWAYRFGDQDFGTAHADTYGALTAVDDTTGLTLTATTFDHRVIIVEFEGITFGDDTPFLTLEIDSTASAMNVACVGVGTPFFQCAAMDSALD